MKEWVRNSVLVAILTPVASCIVVDDYGTAWDQAALDTALAGTWKQIAEARGLGYGIGGFLTYVEKGGAYEVTAYDADGKGIDKRPLYPIKTLRIGPYRFLAVPGPNGVLWRYVVDANAFRICTAIGDAQVVFQQREYPNELNVGKNHSEGSFLEVRVLDGDVEKVIAAIPDTSEYWDCDWKFERARNPPVRRRDHVLGLAE